MRKIRVGVLRGGPSSEYEVSLKTGDKVLSSLPWNKYQPLDIFIDQDGVWHFQGQPKSPDEIAEKIDVAWNALHGVYGEDGGVQRVLEKHRIPYTGSAFYPSVMGFDKLLTKKFLKEHGIQVPCHQIITRDEYDGTTPHELFRKTMMPVVIKPVASGSSFGVSYAETMEELWEGVSDALEHGKIVILEQYIKGKEATVGVIDELRGSKHYPLLPIEIEKPKNSVIWNYEDKYSGETREHCPGRFSAEEKRELGRLAVIVHSALGARHYSRSDFIVSPKGIYFLEINTLPGLTESSLMPLALHEVGVSFPEFLDHIIKLALAGN